jgi:hypothetical protein
MTFGLWNVRSLYRAGSQMTVSRELARYKLDLVGVQEVRWEFWYHETLGNFCRPLKKRLSSMKSVSL